LLGQRQPALGDRCPDPIVQGSVRAGAARLPGVAGALLAGTGLRFIGNLVCGATVYWCALGGAHATWGEIGAYYESHGGSGGALGFPLGDVQTGSQGNLARQFERGRILWSLAQGVFAERRT
jgi:uncharacterized protein with LGFP repeats